MTLADLANFVCGKVNQTDTEDLAACKGFLQRRFQLLWQSQLWKDSLVSYTQALAPTGYTLASTWLPTKSILLVAPIISRVIAVRTDTRKLNVQRSEFYYRVDLDVFTRQGIPTEFVVLPPAVWEFDATAWLQLTLADANAQVTLDLLDADLIGVTRQTVAMTQSPMDVTPSTQRIDTLLKAATNGDLTVRASAATGTITLTNNGSGGYFFYAYNISGQPSLGSPDLLLGPGDSGTLPGKAFVAHAPQNAPSVVTGETAQPHGGLWTGTATFNDAVFAFSPTETDILTVPAADTAGKQRQRIRLVQIPQDTLTVRVLGKRTAPAFSNDLDQPALTGVENCLLAFAQGDMLQRERHYAKAQSLYQEASLLLQGLMAEEVVQMAHEQRVIPEGGYGSEEWDRLYGFSL